eukprot:3076900-Rhodomonas_salina.2
MSVPRCGNHTQCPVPGSVAIYTHLCPVLREAVKWRCPGGSSVHSAAEARRARDGGRGDAEPGSGLRARYTVSGTDIAYRGTTVVRSVQPSVLRACYAKSTVLTCRMVLSGCS